MPGLAWQRVCCDTVFEKCSIIASLHDLLHGNDDNQPYNESIFMASHESNARFEAVTEMLQ